MEDSMNEQHTDPAMKASWNTFNLQAVLYSLAAAAAGVSLLALAQPAAGEVVVTRKTIPIPMTPADTPHPVKISMANNGVDNFFFNLTGSPPNSGRSSSFRALAMGGETNNANPVFAGTFRTYTPALARGAHIGPSATFSPVEVEIENSYAGRTFRGLQGYWGGNPKDRYVGVRFLIGGQTHYGWIRLTVTTTTDPRGPAMSAKITGYAYETVANKAIKAGTAATATSAAEKSAAEVQAPKNIPNQSGPSLGMLAAGADGMPMWRREETSTSN
jgi:hypothetical protein